MHLDQSLQRNSMPPKYESEYLVDSYNELQLISDEYIRNSNNEIEGLVKQLALFSSIFLPLVGVFISSDFFQIKTSTTLNRLAFLVVLSLSITLLLGALSYLQDYYFYRKLADRVDIAREILNGQEVNSHEEEVRLVNKAYGLVSGESGSEYILWIALSTAVVGVFCFTSIMFILLEI